MESPSTLSGIWAAAQKAVDTNANNDNACPSLWNPAQKCSNSADYRPRRILEAETAALHCRGEKEIHVLHNLSGNKYISIGAEEFWLWERMDGTRTVRSLNMEYIEAFGKFGQGVIENLIRILGDAGFLEGRSAPIYTLLQERVRRVRKTSRLRGLFSHFTHAHFCLKQAEAYFSALYKKFGFIFYKKPVLAVLFGVLAADIVLGSYYLFGLHETMLLLPQAGAHDVTFFMVATYLSIFIHENAHGLTVCRFGRRVRNAGVQFYYGNPIPYVDTTDILMRGKRPRIAVSLAGPFSNGILGGACLIATVFIPESLQDNIFTHIGLLNTMLFAGNLVPFIETDGHYIIQDWFDAPHLRRDSLAFVRVGIWKKLFKKEKWCRRDLAHLAYGLIAAGGMAYMIYTGIHLWLYTVKGIVAAVAARPSMVADILMFIAALIACVAIIKFILHKRKFTFEKAFKKQLEES
jgi:putative peptide zinc metalloprotease protein